MEKIRKTYQSHKHLYECERAFETLYGRKPVIKITGTFWSGTMLCHLDNSEMMVHGNRGFLVRAIEHKPFSRQNSINITRAYEDRVEPQTFTME